MTLRTVAPDAEQALLAALRVNAIFTPTVLDGPVTDATASQQVAYVDTVEFDESWRGATRPAKRNDDFTINLVILVRQPGTPAQIKTATWVCVRAVEDTVMADWTLGGVLNQCAEVAGGVVTTYPATIEGLWEGRADLRIVCQHVLSE